MKFHHINESEDVLFVDPTQLNLDMYLRNLEAQRQRVYVGRHKRYWSIDDIKSILCAGTGEKTPIDTHLGKSVPLRPGWTKIGSLQLSPQAMTELTVQWVIQALITQEHENKAFNDIEEKIRLVKKQIKLAKGAK